MSPALFQTFDDKADGSQGAARVAALRARLAELGLAAFLVPRADEHQGEYVPPSEERLAWLTGFTGSAGFAVVTRREAALFADGRYTAQAREQSDAAAFTVVAIHETTPEAWIVTHLEAGEKLGYDPRLHTRDAVKRFKESAAKAGASLVAVAENPIDQIWPDRPRAPAAPIVAHGLVHAGEAAEAKLDRLRAALTKDKADAALLSDPHDVAWLLNIRGSDVRHTPIARVYALVPQTGRAVLFADPARLDPTARPEVQAVAELVPPAEIEPRLAGLAAEGKTIRLDQATCGERWVSLVREKGGKADIAASPIAKMKAVKNAVELEGARSAQRRDGLAVTRFLSWLDREAPKGGLTEIDAVETLEALRRESNELADISFPTIAGAGPNAALPHYRVTRASNRRIEPGIFLVDSGGQYRDGTTDITRTVAVGAPTPEMRDRYTRVLKGHIAIATAVFPKGTTGAQIDGFARRALWEAGEDFDHGTGHGIGSFLSVHEGPQGISKRATTVALEPGMIVSNEPGFYREGHWGIRIENLVVVEPRTIPGGAREMLGFETITLAPIDLALVEPSLMTADEIAWLDAYHARVREALSPGLDEATRAWLEQKTRPLLQ